MVLCNFHFSVTIQTTWKTFYNLLQLMDKNIGRKKRKIFECFKYLIITGNRKNSKKKSRISLDRELLTLQDLQ